MLTRTPNTIKSRRRQRVSDLQVPPTHSDWRLTMLLDDDDEEPAAGVEIFDFPQPPSPSSSQHKREPSSDSSCSSSSDSHASLSTPDTTPAASPTAGTAPKGIVRCKTIKPLTINKRALSPTTPIEDEDFYASHARSFMTLSPPLPASFPSPRSRSQRSRSPAPTIPLPPVPVPTSPSRPTHSRTPSSSSSHSGHVPNFSRPMSSSFSDRPPPRSSLPTDPSAHESVWSGDFKSYYASYAPLIASNSAPSSPIRRTHTPPPPIDTLLDIPGEDSDEALSLSPMVATRNPDLPESDDTDGEKELESEDNGSGKPLPHLPPYTGWHSRPKITIQTGELRDMLRNPSPIPPTPSSSNTVTGPVLRSRWSTSTLSAASVHQREETTGTSPFKLKLAARRYFSVGISSGKDKDKEAKNAKAGKAAGKGKLTVDDVRVLLSPPEPEPVRGAVARTQSDSGCLPSSPPRLSSDSELDFGGRAGRSDLGHSHSRTSSADLLDEDEDDWLLSGTGGLRGRRRKPIPAFLGMHSK